MYDIARASKFKAFTHHIPVYSTFLRPSSTTADTYYFNGIDKEINTTTNLAMTLRDCEPIEKPFIQTSIQRRLNNMWDINFDQVSNKKGLIRNKVISGALNYTSRKQTLRHNTVTCYPNLFLCGELLSETVTAA